MGSSASPLDLLESTEEPERRFHAVWKTSGETMESDTTQKRGSANHSSHRNVLGDQHATPGEPYLVCLTTGGDPRHSDT